MSDRIKHDRAEFDVLGNILETLRLRGSIFFRSSLAAPWGMSLKPNSSPRFHIGFTGECFVGSGEDEVILVQEMDVVMLPKGNQHWIADQPGRELIDSQQVGDACELDNAYFQTGEITNRLMCGLVRFDDASTHPIFDSLPEVVHFRHIQTSDPIWMTITLIDMEMQKHPAHSGAIVDRLTEVLFLQLLHRYVVENNSPAGFFSALRDRRINQALALIHEHPEFNWSLSELGEQVGMSRATLVRHFQDTVGETPMAYITNWRLTKAYNLAKYSNLPMDHIADTVGFASARSMSKAFHRQFNCTPSELRRATNKTVAGE